jgi:hypothetical protein
MGSTYFLAQLIGLVLLSVGASILFQKRVFMKVLNNITGNRSSLFMVGVILLLSGLSVVLTHNIWNAGFLPLVITLIGWILILRGIMSMFVPGDGIARMISWLKVEELSWLYAILVLVIGAYLTWAGFTKD